MTPARTWHGAAALAAAALVAIAAEAAAVEHQCGPIGVELIDPALGDTVHGYVPFRFRLRNLGSQPHRVTLRVPRPTAGPLLYAARTVQVAPGTTAVATVYQPPLPVEGGEATVLVDGTSHRIGIPWSNHAQSPGRWHSPPDEQTVQILISPAMRRWYLPPEDETTLFSRLQEGMAAWSPEWLAYSRFDAVAVTAEELLQAPDGVRDALEQFTECGGVLLVGGPWTPPASWAGPEGSEAGFGHCFVLDTPEEAARAWPNAKTFIRETAQTLGRDRCLTDAHREFPVVSSLAVPLVGMLGLMLLFVIVIGPVNLVVTSRLKRRLWMLWTIPILSALTCGLVVAFALFSEGITPRRRTSTVTILDEAARRATTLGQAAYYAPLAAGGLRFSPDTELTSLSLQRDGGFSLFFGGYGQASHVGGGRVVDWTEDQHLVSGWIAPRVPAHFRVRKSARSLARLQVREGEDGSLRAVNGLGADAERILLCDGQGRTLEARDVKAGAEATLRVIPTRRIPAQQPRDLFRGAWRAGTAVRLTEWTYAASLNGSPFLEAGLEHTRVLEETALVYGILARETDGDPR